MRKKAQKDFEKSKIQKDYSVKSYLFYTITLTLNQEFKNISPNTFLLILAYFTIKSFLGILLPIFSFFPSSEANPEIINNVFKKLCVDLFSSLEDRMLLVISIFILVPLLIEIVCLIWLKKLRVLSYLLLLTSCFAPFVLNICIQIISTNRKDEV